MIVNERTFLSRLVWRPRKRMSEGSSLNIAVNRKARSNPLLNEIDKGFSTMRLPRKSSNFRSEMPWSMSVGNHNDSKRKDLSKSVSLESKTPIESFFESFSVVEEKDEDDMFGDDTFLFSSLRRCISSPCFNEYNAYNYVYIDEGGETVSDLGGLFKKIKSSIDHGQDIFDGVEIDDAFEKLGTQINDMSALYGKLSKRESKKPKKRFKEDPLGFSSSRGPTYDQSSKKLKPRKKSLIKKSFSRRMKNSNKKKRRESMGVTPSHSKELEVVQSLTKSSTSKHISVKSQKKNKRRKRTPKSEIKSQIEFHIERDEFTETKQKIMNTWGKTALKKLSKDLNTARRKDDMYLQEHNLVFDDGDLIGGDLKGIVYCLVRYIKEKDPFYPISIILTHKLYAKSQVFLSYFTELYEEFGSEIWGIDMKHSVIDTLKIWFENYVYDFKDMSLVSSMNIFIRKLKSGSEMEQAFGSELMEAWSKAMRTVTEIQNVLSNHPDAPEVIPGKKKLLNEDVNLNQIDINDYSVLDFHPIEIARQITLIDQSYLMKIPLVELMNKNFEEKAKSPFIKEVHKWFNFLSRWAASEIVSETNLKKRVKLLGHFIIITEKLCELQNYNAFIAVGSGISGFAVSRLKKTWKQVPANLLIKWRTLEKMINPIGNFKIIRKRQENAVPPVIPALNLIFHDLVLIEDGNSQYLDEEGTVINMEKSLLMGHVYSKFAEYQQVHYVLRKVALLQKFVKEKRPLSEQKIEELSYSIEPNKNL
eukprot:TRINITY_DN11742_c0_g1_i1.p1 TRINITY_DN11742_c0_g1~~TRINITY_DN11742_c0_g1_i1.p1  ORF type:complete len:758 (-),score=156.26 TRINITY_DN11742_c0_g1_i1:9-2282(-)